MSRYEPRGIPLTEVEAEVIDHLIEECAEVIHAASKVKRFGRENPHPELGISSTYALGLEVGDLISMVNLLAKYKLVEQSDVKDGEARKLERLARYSRLLP